MTRIFNSSDHQPSFVSLPDFPTVKKIVNDANLSDEQIVKTTAQLDYHGRTDPNKIIDKARLICNNYKPPPSDFKFPTKRFGKTNIMMPIVTTGGMRFQQTWCPDNLPIAIGKKEIEAACQENLLNCVRRAIRLGANHFETARMYGTSEMQIVDALIDLMEADEITRDDFILQTKIPPKKTNAEFEKVFNLSWR